MYICYLDESGIPDIGKGTSHFVFLGLAILANTWKQKDEQILGVKGRYGLLDEEIHAGWMARRYLEQERIPSFAAMNWNNRRIAMRRERDSTLLRIAATRSKKALDEAKKTFRKTARYVHLTRDERMGILRELADLVASWADCALFAEATDKMVFVGQPAPANPPEVEGFSQVVSRLQFALNTRDANALLVQDNNPTVAKRFVALMRQFHAVGTMFTQIPNIVETPLFVDSRLTSMVQMADVCAYATRRFFENGEADLFDRIYGRFNRAGGRVVGIRHYTGSRPCACRVCREH